MQVVFNGLVEGLVIALMAAGFAVVYFPTRVLHVGMAGVYVVVPFVVWQGFQWGWPGWMALSVGVSAGVLVSALCEVLNHGPLDKKRASMGVHLASSLGIFICLVQVTAMLWGNETKVIRANVDEVYALGGLFVTQAQVIAALVSMILLGGSFLWLRFTGLGLQFRALSDNPNEFALRGYNTRLFRMMAFALSGLFISTAALINANDIGFDANNGMPALLLAVVATIIGGVHSFAGVLLGGILLGLVRAGVVWHLSANWQDAVTFLILAIFLLLRPQGVIAPQTRLEGQT